MTPLPTNLSHTPGQLTATFVGGYKTELDANLALPGLTSAGTAQPVQFGTGNTGFSYTINSGFAPATAAAILYTDNNYGLQLGNLHLRVPIAYLGPLEVDMLEADYSSTNQNPAPSGWQCGKTAKAGELCGSIQKLRIPNSFGLDGSIDWIAGAHPELQSISLSCTSCASFGLFSLSNLGGGVAFNPFYLTLTGSLTALKLFSGTTAMLIAFGSQESPFTLTQNEVALFGSSYPLSPLVGDTFDEPILAFGNSQSISLPDPLGSIPITSYYNVGYLPVNGASPYIQFGGSINTAFPFGIQASVTGEAGYNPGGHPEFPWNLTMAAGLALVVPGIVTITGLKAEGVLSNDGVTGCMQVPSPPFSTRGETFYVGVRWDGKSYTLKIFPDLQFYAWSLLPQQIPSGQTGCDAILAPFSEQVPQSADAAHAAAGVRTFTIPRGSGGENVSLTGAGGAPSVRLTAPGGQTLDVDQASGIRQAGRLSGARSASLHQTFLAVENPVPGTYTITPLPGSVAITTLATAVVLAPARITALVSGRGERRVLRYAVARRPGQRVVLVERGPGTYRVLKTIDGGGHGVLRFTPAPGPGGPREIVAQVSINGMAPPALTVARFIAPAPPRLVIRRLVGRRKGTRVTVSWSSTAGTSQYVLLLSLSNGRQRRLQVLGDRRSANFAGVPQTAAVTVIAYSESASGQAGPPRGVRLEATARFDNGIYPLGAPIPGLGRTPAHRHRHHR